MQIKASEEFRKFLRNLQYSNFPRITTFFSPFWGVWKDVDNIFKAVIPPAYASAYLINRSAMLTATKSPPIGLADWPSWRKSVEFEYVEMKSISLSLTDSSLEESRSISKQTTKKIRSLLNLRNLSVVSFSQKFEQIYWHPTIWKFYLRRELKKNKSRQIGDNSSIFL
jgi:hypothetical protein